MTVEYMLTYLYKHGLYLTPIRIPVKSLYLGIYAPFGNVVLDSVGVLQPLPVLCWTAHCGESSWCL